MLVDMELNDESWRRASPGVIITDLNDDTATWFIHVGS